MSDAVDNPLDMVTAGNVSIETVAPDTYYVSSFSGVTAFETDDGLVLVDTGLDLVSSRMAALLREQTDAPVDTVIYTHGHRDHAFGLEPFLLDDQEPPEVIAHEAMAGRFDRYRETAGHNEAINTRQFVGAAPDQDGIDDPDESNFGWPDYPPTTVYDESLTIQVGECSFELHHGNGETDDHTWLYCPERDVCCSGDFVIGVAPNAGNPQKVQRYPWEWANVLREIAGTNPGTLCPGHGEPIVDDPAEIRERLLAAADYLETIVDRTLSVLNDGSPPHVDVVREVDVPDPDQPWLQEVYDDGEFVVRSVLRYYGGWWSGRPSELKPAGRGPLATELAALAGGPDALAERARELADDDQLRVACHLADYALEAAPANEGVQEAVAACYEARREVETDLMSRNIYTAAADYARQGRPFR